MATLTGSEYCFNHDPAAAAKRAKARKTGGERQRTPHAGELGTIPADIKNIVDARKILDYALQELGAMENSIARIRAYVAVFEAYKGAFEIGEHEQRIAALEARANVKP